MNNEKSLHRMLLFGGMAALLILAFLFDLAIRGLQVSNATGAGLEWLLIVLFSLFELLIVLGGLALFRTLMGVRGRMRLPAIVFFIVGLLISFGAVLLFFLPLPIALYALVEYLQPGTYLFQSGALLMAAGILGWGRANPPPPPA